MTDPWTIAGLALVYALGFLLARAFGRHVYDQWEYDPESGKPPAEQEAVRRLWAGGAAFTAWLLTPLFAALAALALCVRVFAWLSLPKEKS